MNIELIILQDLPFESSFTKSDGLLYYRSEAIIEWPVKINFNITEIDFEKEQQPTYYYLFCYNLNAYEEIAKYSHKMILMNAIYPFLGKIVKEFNFAGIVNLFNIISHYPMIYGLNAIIKDMKNIHEHFPMIRSEKYGTIYKPDMKISEIIQEYLLLYHEYMTTNNNQNQKE